MHEWSVSLYPYLEHLADRDLSLLIAMSGEHRSVDDLLTDLHSRPGYLDTLLGHPSVFSALFAESEHEAIVRASPFLTFAVLIHRLSRDLEGASFVDEWMGPGRRVPMFQVSAVREFIAHPDRRLFLAELLASYTRVASGSFWIQTTRGPRRRRFSELDPLQLIELLDVVPDHERSSIYRRLGDLTLFLTGVFPDYAAGGLLAPSRRRRLEWVISQQFPSAAEPLPAQQALGLLEQLGSRAYAVADNTVNGSANGLLAEISETFSEARRILNMLTDRYLFSHREQWFPQP